MHQVTVKIARVVIIGILAILLGLAVSGLLAFISPGAWQDPMNGVF